MAMIQAEASHVQNQFSSVETPQKLVSNQPRGVRGLPRELVDNVSNTFLAQARSKSPLTAVNIPSESGAVNTFFAPDEQQMDQMEKLCRMRDELKAAQQTYPSRTTEVKRNKVNKQIEAIVGALSYSHPPPDALSEDLKGSPAYKDLQKKEPDKPGTNSLPAVAVGAIGLLRVPKIVKKALLAFEATVIMAGCTGAPQANTPAPVTIEYIPTATVQPTLVPSPSPSPEPIKQTVTSPPSTPEVIQNPENMITRDLIGKVLANMGGPGVLIPDQRTVSADGENPTGKMKAIDLDKEISRQWRTRVGLSEEIVKPSNAIEAVRWISSIANLRGLKTAERVNTRDLLGQLPGHVGYDIFRFRNQGDKFLQDSTTPFGFVLRNGARVQVLGQNEGKIMLVVSDSRLDANKKPGTSYFVALDTNDFKNAFGNVGSVETNPDGSMLIRVTANDVIFEVPGIEKGLAQEIQKESGVGFVNLINDDQGLHEHPNPVVPYPPEAIVPPGTLIAKVQIDNNDNRVYAWDVNGNRLASVSYNIETGKWIWEAVTPPPTQETAKPTELGTLAKVKIGKTEVTAGLDIKMDLNLWGTKTPVRLVVSHDIINLQADAWAQDFINGQTPQQVLQKGFEKILNLRPTGNKWGITRGNGLKPTLIDLPPGTELVFIFASYEDFGKTNLKADPMANNDRVATEYNIATRQFRVVYSGGSQDNIVKYTQGPRPNNDLVKNMSNVEYYGNTIFAQSLSVLTLETQLHPEASDKPIMNGDPAQQAEVNVLTGLAYRDVRTFVKFVPPKNTS